jgi:iron complex outermembrane recepter protein
MCRRPDLPQEDLDMRVANCSLFCSLSLAAGVAAAADNRPIEEVIVTATLREQTLVAAPASVTVLDEGTLRDAGRQHFEDVLTGVPNLHWAGGTSRPRFFQIRGIGEREQYEGAPNPSVGFLIDDIDFSGIGMPATLFDVERIEVLRGPQGTRYGANALAGLIAVRGVEPGDEFDVATEASYGEYRSESFGAAVTGPVTALDSSWRLAVQRYRSDGYRTDRYLRRDDTNDRDELTGRFKWRWQPSADTTVDFTWLHADIDNGYDGWSIDNTRRSLSDDPGKDAQRSDGAALRLQTPASAAADLTVIATAADSDAEHSYDGDWGNPQSWLPYTYDYFYRALRDRSTRSLEARLASPASSQSAVAWLAGVYALNLQEDMRERSVGEYVDPDAPEYSGTTDDSLNSDYDATNVALFGQLDGRWATRGTWSVGMRAEQRDADYRDAGIDGGDPRATREAQRDRMWGGQVSVGYEFAESKNVFAALSRGYKAGGFNLGRGALQQADFGRENIVSAEAGLKTYWNDARAYWDASVFYMRRDRPQVKTGDQLEPTDPNSFVFFTVNAERGANYGIESSVRWRVTDTIEVGASAALLRTSIEGYRYRDLPVPKREQAHAPEYQLSFNAAWRHPLGWMARVDVAAVDDFYFDVPPNPTRAHAYSLTNLKLGYEGARWSAYLWGRNVFDEEYAVRGFYFGNEPPLFENRSYIQLGEPQQFGLTVRWQLQ